jgi:hypothetical protein
VSSQSGAKEAAEKNKKKLIIIISSSSSSSHARVTTCPESSTRPEVMRDISETARKRVEWSCSSSVGVLNDVGSSSNGFNLIVLTMET